MTQRDEVLYLKHMRDYALEVLSFVEGRRRTDLDNDTQFAFAVRYGVGMLGEAAANVPPAVLRGIPEIDWSAIIGMRHRLIHGYDTVNCNILWDAVQNDLPALIEELHAVIGEIEAPDRGDGNDPA
ncbi:MAG: DUF86 domain-containing protein [Armatimonadota bacterium]